MAEIIDISRELKESTAYWPGDTPFSSSTVVEIGPESNVKLSSFVTSPHVGTHADAPSHFIREGLTIDEVALAPFYGPATVIDVGETDLITEEHLPDGHEERLLFKSRSGERADTKFVEEYPAFDPAMIKVCAERGVILMGTDAASVDPVDSGALPAHHTLARNGIINLENLKLTHVEAGNYTLSAFPIKLVDKEAAPVRAVLIRE